MLGRRSIIDVLIVVMTGTALVVGMLTTQYTGYQLGFTTAKTLVEESSLGEALRTPDDVRTISGTVTAVNDTSITLRVLSNDPFDSLLTRTVLVASSTEITKLTLQDPVAFQSEMDAFIKATNSGAKGLPTSSPEFFTLSVIDLAGIKAGDTIIVTALDNIKSLKQFTAHLIQVQTRVASSTSP